MKRFIMLAMLALTACAPAVVKAQPPVVTPPVVVVVPAPVIPASVPAPVPAPVVSVLPSSAPMILPLPVGPLTVLDASQVTVTLADSTLTIALAPNVSGTWLRLTLPDGHESGITDNGACHCTGLGGNGPHLLNVGFLAGLTVLTSPTLDGPWTVAARTQ